MQKTLEWSRFACAHTADRNLAIGAEEKGKSWSYAAKANIHLVLTSNDEGS